MSDKLEELVALDGRRIESWRWKPREADRVDNQTQEPAVRRKHFRRADAGAPVRRMRPDFSSSAWRRTMRWKRC
jgi:hypothetical protein